LRPRLGTVARLAAWLTISALAILALAAIPPGMSPRDSKRAEPEAYVIPAGRESAVMAFLEPIVHAHVGPLGIADVRIEGGRITLVLAAPAGAEDARPCTLPSGVARPGVVWIEHAIDATAMGAPGRARVDDVVFEAHACVDPAVAAEALDEMASSLAHRAHDDVWQRAAQADHPAESGGILSPWWSRFAAPPAQAIARTLAFAVLASIVAAACARGRDRTAADDARPDRVRVLVLLVLVVAGVALRAAAAHAMPVDGDEAWAFPSSHAITTGDHDSWVHPPVHRAVQRAWVAAIGWRPGDTLLRLRAVSVLAGSLALVACGAAIASRVRSLLALLPFAVLALSPAIVAASALARPYALASAFAAFTFAAVIDVGSRPAGRARWLAAISCAGAAMWTDLATGAIAALLVLVALAGEIAHARRAAWRALLVVLAIGAFAVPLFEGASRASREQLHPTTSPSSAPDLRPRARPELGRAADVLAWSVGVPNGERHLAIASLALALAAWGATRVRPRAPSSWKLAMPLVAIVLAYLLARNVAVRPRNLLFLPHLELATVAIVVASRRRAC
jgi:hypothetical protein